MSVDISKQKSRSKNYWCWEVLRRKEGKVVMNILKKDVMNTVSLLQVCAKKLVQKPQFMLCVILLTMNTRKQC